MRLNLAKDLTPLKAAAVARIDADAEAVRGNFITLGAGQAMVYQQKRVEAEAYIADPQIAPAEIPHIVREAEMNDISLFDQAVIILTMSENWKTVSAVIENLRLGAKRAVEAASSPAAIDQAGNIDWSPTLAYAVSS
jgi:hypothetical protein